MDNIGSIGIFQGIILNEDYISNNDLITLVPYDNTSPMDHEINIYKPIIEKSLHKNFEYSGIVSRSFETKTGLDFLSIKKIISSEDADIFIFSPHQYEEKIWESIWDQTYIFHEKSIKLIQQTLILAGFPKLTLEDLVHTPWCFSHFWFAKSEIFEDIAKDLILINRLMRKNSLSQFKVKNYSSLSKPSEGELTKNYILLPFAMERIVGYLIRKKLDKRYKLYVYKDPRSLDEKFHKNQSLLNNSYKKILENKKIYNYSISTKKSYRDNIYSTNIFNSDIRKNLSKYCDTPFNLERLMILKNGEYI